jgi:hypothetical protein
VNRVGKGAGSCSEAGQNAAVGGESLVTATVRVRTDVADDVVWLSSGLLHNLTPNLLM